MKLRKATAADLRAIGTALFHLRAARDMLSRAGAVRAAAKVRAVLKSADGARRHAERAQRSTR